MKKRFALILFVSLLVFFLFSAFVPLPQSDPGGSLDPGLVIIISAVLIPVLIQGLKFIAATFHVVWKEQTVMLICFGVALIVAVLWLKPIFPAWPGYVEDPTNFGSSILAFLSGGLTVISSIFGLATLVYRFILKAVFDALKIGETQVKALAG
jgi:hypothetical protein